VSDPHAPTSAGPEPTDSWIPPAADAASPPLGGGGDPLERPEIQVGAAFAGGVLAAVFLKAITGGRRK
jgi:hypothetical protein